MPKILKVLFIGIGCLFLLVVAIVAVVAATFNPNDYKPLIIKLVQEKKQRTLSIPGEIKLTFFRESVQTLARSPFPSKTDRVNSPPSNAPACRSN